MPTKIWLTVWKDKYDCEQAWTRLQQISEMTEVKKQEDEDTEEETSDKESDNEEQDIAANEGEDSNEESRESGNEEEDSEDSERKFLNIPELIERFLSLLDVVPIFLKFNILTGEPKFGYRQMWSWA